MNLKGNDFLKLLDYTPEQLGGIPNACDNCHEYAQGKPTVGDSMTWKADK